MPSFDPSTLPAPNLKQPVTWQGPSADGPFGGITFSMLSKWLVCRERFLVEYILGLKQPPRFSQRMEYGNMWHICEEAYAGHDIVAAKGPAAKLLTDNLWKVRLKDYATKLCRTYPLQQNEVVKWYNVCQRQFPLYIEHWARHSDVTTRTPLLQEQVFDVPYILPSGRTVRLRGKWDSVDLIDNHTDSNGIKYSMGIWLMENKTKGDIDEVQIQRQLKFDLQTMMYLVALDQFRSLVNRGTTGIGTPRVKIEQSILGVRYNVIRRPLSGGKGTIVQHEATKGSKCPKCKGEGKAPKPRSRWLAGVEDGDKSLCQKCLGVGRVGGKPAETEEHYYERLAQYIKDEPGHYFMRWKVGVTAEDITKFRQTCLSPVLEQLCDWYDYVCDNDPNSKTRYATAAGLHYTMPYGVYSPLLDGGTTDLDNYLLTGSKVGLVQRTSMFDELQ